MPELSSSGSIPSLIGLNLTALGFGPAILDFMPFNGTESIDPSADEVCVLPCSLIRPIVEESLESP